MRSEQEPVDVSIIMLTYFHENYIAQALDSVLAQETNLQIEVLIGDDASEDQTPAVIQDYAARYPDIIRPILRPENLGGTRNSWDLYRRAKGKYLAILEGDDYWSDPRKLQKQWNFLEEHQEYIGCCGKCLIVNENGQPDYTRTPHFTWNKKVFTMEDLLESWNLPGQGGNMMFHNIFQEMEPEEYSIFYRAHRNVGDKTLALFLLSKGPMYCSNEILSCYRSVDQAGKHNHFSIHHANPYRNYDMFLYPCRLETWARKNLGLRRHLGKRGDYRFCRFVEECVKTPSLKRLRCLGEMIARSHQPIKYSLYVVKALIEME